MDFQPSPPSGAGRWALPSSAIPCGCRMDQEFSRRLSMSEVKDDSNASKTLSAAARRSFFRRKHKHKRSGSKDGKDLLALDAFSNDSIPLFEGKWLSSRCRRAFRIGLLLTAESSQPPLDKIEVCFAFAQKLSRVRCLGWNGGATVFSGPSVGCGFLPQGLPMVTTRHCSSSHHTHVLAAGRRTGPGKVCLSCSFCLRDVSLATLMCKSVKQACPGLQ